MSKNTKHIQHKEQLKDAPEVSTFLREVGTRIYTQREALAMTQKELAEKANISMHTLSNYECGKTTMDIYTLSRISSLLKLSTDKLLGLDFSQDDCFHIKSIIFTLKKIIAYLEKEFEE